MAERVPPCATHTFSFPARESSLAVPSPPSPPRRRVPQQHTRPDRQTRAEPRRTKAETSDADVGLWQTKEQFIQCLDTAMQSEPKPLSSDERYRLTWEVRVVGVVPHRLSRSRCTQAEAILPQG